MCLRLCSVVAALLVLPAGTLGDCDDWDGSTCEQCTVHTSTFRGCGCSWDHSNSNCRADCGEVDAGYSRECVAPLGPDDVAPGSNRLGADCGWTDGWCEASLLNLVCDEDGFGVNECRECPCGAGVSCGRGSNGYSGPAWTCGSQRGDAEGHLGGCDSFDKTSCASSARATSRAFAAATALGTTATATAEPIAGP